MASGTLHASDSDQPGVTAENRAASGAAIAARPPERVLVLGSTGSIGVNSLQVIEHLTRTRQKRFEVVGLAAGTRVNQVIEQAKATRAKAVAICDPLKAHVVEKALPGVTVFAGPQAATQLVEQIACDTVVSAIVGVAGLAPTLAALKLKRKVCLANKEPLVAAGPLVMPLTRQATHDSAASNPVWSNQDASGQDGTVTDSGGFGSAGGFSSGGGGGGGGGGIWPVDSEHSAVFQCLNGRQALKDTSKIKKVVLTASGGPFRSASREVIESATVEQALQHPTWQMGPKITIDSATMMNKALEIIEAHHLFGLPPEKIDVVIHPESVVHAFVEFVDHSVLAQLGPPDMRTPIQYALTGQDRASGCSDALDFYRLTQLNFQPPDAERFPALKLAYDVMEAGGTAGAVFNAANEQAVQAFLDRQIRFGRIVQLVGQALSAVPVKPLTCLQDVLDADEQARAYVADAVKSAGAL